ncbi:MAG: hypothetical protein FD146_729 [Anaerolineaceae bacterium]|nr:MAG: hypothetical protein FD146_729 [Anaerolineaceae bacterium]
MNSKRFTSIFALLFVGLFLLSACAPKQAEMTAILPVGRAYAEGQEIYFMHTEASDAEVAGLLTDMMDSPVLFVPSLDDVPNSVLANVYVFTNGIEGMGPLGFAPDVFDSPPGTDGYSPLRRLNLVTWADPAAARELKSATDVLAAEAAGEVTIEQPGVVINMPFVVWDGGKR